MGESQGAPHLNLLQVLESPAQDRTFALFSTASLEKPRLIPSCNQRRNWTLANFEKNQANLREIYGCSNKHLQEPETIILVPISQEGARELKLYGTT